MKPIYLNPQNPLHSLFQTAREAWKSHAKTFDWEGETYLLVATGIETPDLQLHIHLSDGTKISQCPLQP